jgi:alpha-tubulin suppressor-like RCC1 family protein
MAQSVLPNSINYQDQLPALIPGVNNYSQLGDGTTVSKNTLTQMTIPTGKTPASVSCGEKYTIVLMTDSSVYGCGFNELGQLGDGTTVNNQYLEINFI